MLKNSIDLYEFDKLKSIPVLKPVGCQLGNILVRLHFLYFWWCILGRWHCFTKYILNLYMRTILDS